MSKQYQLFVILIGIIFFFPLLGNFHLFDWDEINFAESAREMITTGDYMRVRINYEPFWEKPPFFFWLQVLSMKLFGINEFAARFPNAVIGVFTLLLIYRIGKEIKNEQFGWFWSLLYVGSFLPHLYFKSGIIDPVFNFFIFLAVYYVFKTLNNTNKNWHFPILGGLALGLAVITKGPVAVLLTLLTFIVIVIWKRGRLRIKFLDILSFTIAALLVTCLWFGYEVYENGFWFIIEFFKYQIELFTQPVAGHEQPFFYHPLVILLGCFPLSVLALRSFTKKFMYDEDQVEFSKWMKALFWVVLVIFSISKTKIVHYSSMCYLPMSFLAAQHVYYLFERKQKLDKFTKIMLWVIGCIFSVLLIACPILFSNPNILEPLIKDSFGKASLNFPMGWQGWEFLLGLIYLIGLIVAILNINRLKVYRFVTILCLSAGVTLMGYSIFVVPKIERFSQGPAIDFLKSIADEDAYVTTIGYKSYAHYFYGKTKYYTNNERIIDIKAEYKKTLKDKNDFNVIEQQNRVNDWLIDGDIDKKVYFLTKITRREEMKKYSHLKLIKSSGGFDFYLRNKSKKYK